MSNFPALPTGSSRNKIEFLYDLLSGLSGGGGGELNQVLVLPSNYFGGGIGEKKFLLNKALPIEPAPSEIKFYANQNGADVFAYKVTINGLVSEFKDVDPNNLVSLTFSLNIPFRINWNDDGVLTDAEKVELCRYIRGSISSQIIHDEKYLFDDTVHLTRTGESSTGDSFFSFLGEIVVMIPASEIAYMFERYPDEGFPIEIGIKMHGDLDGSIPKFNNADIVFTDPALLRLVGAVALSMPDLPQ